MDRIRKALDLAALERASPPPRSPPPPSSPPPPAGANPAASGAPPKPELVVVKSDSAPRAAKSPPRTPGAIVYTHTRVFSPAPGVLESNRVLNSESVDPAATAFRMLRTQVLQRMDAHGWRSLAMFSPNRKTARPPRRSIWR